MSLQPIDLMLLIGIPLVGGGLLLYAMRKRPQWRGPITWAAAGVIFYELFQKAVALLISAA